MDKIWTNQKWTVFTPMGLSHILLAQLWEGSAVDDVLCHLRPPNLVWKPVLLLCACAVKNWLRKAGRAARRS